MSSPVQIVAIVVSTGLLFTVIDLVRRRKLTEEYSFIWIVCAVALLALSLHREVLHLIAGWLGVFYPPAVLLLVLIAFVFIACLYFSVVISGQRQQIERLIEEVAIVAAQQRDLTRGAADLTPPANATMLSDTPMSDPLFTPLGIDHVVLRVRDQAASQKFYAGVLGCTLDHVNERISLVHLRFGDQLIDLFPGDGPAAPASAGVDHVCLSITCDDLPALAADLRRRGVTIDGDVVTRRGAYGDGPSLYIRDPDGYKIELKPR